MADREGDYVEAVLQAERRGFRDGKRNRHYLPELNFATAGEWHAWWRGWRAGNAEYWAAECLRHHEERVRARRTLNLEVA